MQYDFALAAGQSQTIDIAGRFFKYKSGTGVIRVRASSGGYVDLLPGQGVWNVNFTSLIITDKSGAANVGVLVAGEFDFRDDRITGTVDVVDGGKSKTLAGVAFYTSITQVANPGVNSTIQLWNPVGSGKNAIIRAYGFQADIATVVIGRASQAQLGVSQGNPPSKKFGGASSVMVAQTQAGGSITASTYFPGANMAAGGTYEKVLQEPIIVPPGMGMLVYTAAFNVALGLNLEYCEESV